MFTRLIVIGFKMDMTRAEMWKRAGNERSHRVSWDKEQILCLNGPGSGRVPSAPTWTGATRVGALVP